MRRRRVRLKLTLHVPPHRVTPRRPSAKTEDSEDVGGGRGPSIESQVVRRDRSDPDAFERFYREHVEQVQRFVARRVDDPYLAADLTADVFLAAIESARSYRRSRGKPVAWLFGIARNVVAGEQRRKARELRATTRVRGRELVDEHDLAALHRRIYAEAAARSLWQEMAELSPAERAVLELVAVDGLTVGEAARALRIGPVAARVRLHRARRALHDRLGLSTLGLRDVPEVS